MNKSVNIHTIAPVLGYLLDFISEPFQFIGTCKMINARISRKKKLLYEYNSNNSNAKYTLTFFCKEIQLPYNSETYCIAACYDACKHCELTLDSHKIHWRKVANVDQFISLLSIYKFKKIDICLTGGFGQKCLTHIGMLPLYYHVFDIKDIIENMKGINEVILKITDVPFTNKHFEQLLTPRVHTSISDIAIIHTKSLIKKLDLNVPRVGTRTLDYLEGCQLTPKTLSHLKNNIEELSLVFKDGTVFGDVCDGKSQNIFLKLTLPHCLQYCTNLTKLKLQTGITIPYCYVSKMNRLKTLILPNGHISDNKDVINTSTLEQITVSRILPNVLLKLSKLKDIYLDCITNNTEAEACIEILSNHDNINKIKRIVISNKYIKQHLSCAIDAHSSVITIYEYESNYKYALFVLIEKIEKLKIKDIVYLYAEENPDKDYDSIDIKPYFENVKYVKNIKK